MKFLAWIVSWFLYGIGHLISIPMYKLPKIFGWLYPVYNQTMHYSVVVNDKNDLNVWLTRQQRIDLAVETLIDLMEEDDELTIPAIIEMLLKDHDFVYVAMVAQQLQQQLWDQVTLGIEVGDIAAVKSIDLIKAAEAAIGNRTPGVIFMNPRNMTICDEPGIVDKCITPTIENSFGEVSLPKNWKEGLPLGSIGAYAGEATKSDIVGFMRNRNPDFCTDIPREPNNSESPCNEIALSESQPCTLEEPIVFEIGKAYRHSGGGEMFIVGRAETTLWGNCLVAEEAGYSGHALRPIGCDIAAATNWKEIPMSEWMKNFS